MKKSRSSKGLLTKPNEHCIPNAIERENWLKNVESKFIASPANKHYYSIILRTLWPSGSGIPGPHVSEKEIRIAINLAREKQGKPPYVDAFRRMRELQGEEGLTCIIKEGTCYQLQHLTLSNKRERREKPPKTLWNKIKEDYSYRCAHCSRSEPDVQLSPDHRVPRSRGGTNNIDNWQPLCESCNILKSSSCSSCNLNCYVCSWAFPNDYKPITISDENKELLRRASEKKGLDQSEIANIAIRKHLLS